MRTYTWKILVLFALGSLVGCVQPAVIAPSNYSSAPNNVHIDVIFNEEGCPIKTQTSSKTCPFVGPSDPVDTACQEPSPGNGRRKIIWEADGDIDFTLEFPNGSPLTSTTTGHCKLAAADSSFSCLVRRDSEPPTLDWAYKYDVVVNAGQRNECRLDPRVYLMR